MRHPHRIVPVGFLLLGLLALGAAPCWAKGGPAPAAPLPKTLKEIDKRLANLAGRIDALVALAKKDPDERKIDIYKKYKGKELKKTRGRAVRAEHLVQYMIAADKNFNVRDKARDALDNARFRGDPDLSNSEKQGNRTRRAYFCDKFLVKHLRHDDRIARALTHKLLTEYYPDAKRTHAEIRIYNPDTEKTQKPAIAAWKRFLKRQ